jgi:hypothetical protein
MEKSSLERIERYVFNQLKIYPEAEKEKRVGKK